MKCQISYNRPEPDTQNGHIFVMRYVYTSQDKREIDKIEDDIKRMIGDGVILDYSRGDNNGL